MILKKKSQPEAAGTRVSSVFCDCVTLPVWSVGVYMNPRANVYLVSALTQFAYTVSWPRSCNPDAYFLASRELLSYFRQG